MPPNSVTPTPTTRRSGSGGTISTKKDGWEVAVNNAPDPLRRPAHQEKFRPHSQRALRRALRSSKQGFRGLRPYRPVSARVNVRCIYYMQTRRKVDLANLIEATCDILVKAGVLADDNSQIVAAHDGSRVEYDKNDPRVEIEIEEMEDDT